MGNRIKATRLKGSHVFVLAASLNQLEQHFLSEAQVWDYDSARTSLGMNILEDLRAEARTGQEEVSVTLEQYRVLNPSTRY